MTGLKAKIETGKSKVVTVKMKCTVFYESWQLECCGKAFSIGDIVKWFVYKIEREQILAPVDLGTIDYCYEAHDEIGKNYLFERL